MPQNYVPIFIFIAVVGILIPITLLLPSWFGRTIRNARS